MNAARAYELLLHSKPDLLTASARFCDVERSFAGHPAYAAVSVPVRIALWRELRFFINRPDAEALKRDEETRLQALMHEVADDDAPAMPRADGGAPLRPENGLHVEAPAVPMAVALPARPMPLAHADGGAAPDLRRAFFEAELEALGEADGAAMGVPQDPVLAAIAAAAPQPAGDGRAVGDARRFRLRADVHAAAGRHHAAGRPGRQARPPAATGRAHEPVRAFCNELEQADADVMYAFSEWSDDHVQALDRRAVAESRDTGAPATVPRPPHGGRQYQELTSRQREVLFLDHALSLERAACNDRVAQHEAGRKELIAAQSAAEAAFAAELRRLSSVGLIELGTPWEIFRYGQLVTPPPGPRQASAADGYVAVCSPASHHGEAVAKAAAESHRKLLALAEALAAFEVGASVKEVYERVVTKPMNRLSPPSASADPTRHDQVDAIGSDASSALSDLQRLAEHEQYVFNAACCIGDVTVVDELLTSGAIDPAARRNFGFRLAAARGHVKVVERLLRDPRINPHDCGHQAARLAAKADNAQLLQRLLYSNPSGVATAEASTWRAAAEHGSISVIRLLLRGDLMPLNAESASAAVGPAIERGHVAVAELLLAEPCVDPAYRESHSLRAAAEGGLAGLVQRLLRDERVDPTARQNEAISSAAAHGHVDVVCALLADSRAEHSVAYRAALHAACSNGHVEIVDIVLADSRLQLESGGSTAIVSASQQGHLSVVQRLLQDPRVDAAAADNAAVLAAAQHAHHAVIHRLLDTDAVSATSCLAETHHLERLLRALTSCRHHIPLCMLNRTLSNMPEALLPPDLLRKGIHLPRLAAAAWVRRRAAVAARIHKGSNVIHTSN